MMTLLVFVTCPDPEQAASLATILVEERLAACGNILSGMRSIYRWEDKIHDGKETLLLLKTTADVYPRLETRLKALHPYEVPEIIAVDLVKGLPAYLAWVTESVQ